MPLERGRVIRYDAARMTFEFTMMHKAKIIACQISSTAMDELAGARGTLPAEREAQFYRLRDMIESIASDLFDEGTMEAGDLIRVFYHHARHHDEG
jgi:Protein of unknown function (DUF1488)